MTFAKTRRQYFANGLITGLAIGAVVGALCVAAMQYGAYLGLQKPYSNINFKQGGQNHDTDFYARPD